MTTTSTPTPAGQVVQQVTSSKKVITPKRQFFYRTVFGFCVFLGGFFLLMAEVFAVQNAVKAAGQEAGANAVYGYPSTLAWSLVLITVVLVIWPAATVILQKNWRQLIPLAVFTVLVILVVPFSAGLLYGIGALLTSPNYLVMYVVALVSLAIMVTVVVFWIGATSTVDPKLQAARQAVTDATSRVAGHESAATAASENLASAQRDLDKANQKFDVETEAQTKASEAFSAASQLANDPKKVPERAALNRATARVTACQKVIEELSSLIDSNKRALGSASGADKKTLSDEIRQLNEELKLARGNLGKEKRRQAAAEIALNGSSPMIALEKATAKRDSTQLIQGEAADAKKSAERVVEDASKLSGVAGNNLTAAQTAKDEAEQALLEVQKTTKKISVMGFVLPFIVFGLCVMGSASWFAIVLATAYHISGQPGY